MKDDVVFPCHETVQPTNASYSWCVSKFTYVKPLRVLALLFFFPLYTVFFYK